MCSQPEYRQQKSLSEAKQKIVLRKFGLVNQTLKRLVNHRQAARPEHHDRNR
jgi:hypothetical protein